MIHSQHVAQSPKLHMYAVWCLIAAVCGQRLFHLMLSVNVNQLLVDTIFFISMWAGGQIQMRRNFVCV
jgi:hypothetical protein